VEESKVAEYRTAMYDLRELARTRCLDRVTTLGLPLQVENPVPVVEETPEMGWELSRIE
jgi:hypothetical protein